MHQQQKVDMADTLDVQSLSLGDENAHSDAKQLEAPEVHEQQKVDVADTIDMQSLSLGDENAHSDAKQLEATRVRLRVPGLKSFDLDLQPRLTIAELKHLAREKCGVEPGSMRIMMGGRVLKDTDVVEGNGISDGGNDLQVIIKKTESESLLGGGSGFQQGPNTKPQKIVQNDFGRGISGSKGLRASRVSGRCGGNGLIRKYGLMMKRQEFREKAEAMGWVKYR